MLLRFKSCYDEILFNALLRMNNYALYLRIIRHSDYANALEYAKTSSFHIHLIYFNGLNREPRHHVLDSSRMSPLIRTTLLEHII